MDAEIKMNTDEETTVTKEETLKFLAQYDLSLEDIMPNLNMSKTLH